MIPLIIGMALGFTVGIAVNVPLARWYVRRKLRHDRERLRQ